MRRALAKFWRNLQGGTAIEYALIASLVILGLLVALNSIGGSTQAMYENLDTKWDAAASS